MEYYSFGSVLKSLNNRQTYNREKDKLLSWLLIFLSKTKLQKKQKLALKDKFSLTKINMDIKYYLDDDYHKFLLIYSIINKPHKQDIIYNKTESILHFL